jgi:hypothetical protein
MTSSSSLQRWAGLSGGKEWAEEEVDLKMGGAKWGQRMDGRRSRFNSTMPKRASATTTSLQVEAEQRESEEEEGPRCQPHLRGASAIAASLWGS